MLVAAHQQSLFAKVTDSTKSRINKVRVEVLQPVFSRTVFGSVVLAVLMQVTVTMGPPFSKRN